jgi:hypothetical protein
MPLTKLPVWPLQTRMVYGSKSLESTTDIWPLDQLGLPSNWKTGQRRELIWHYSHPREGPSLSLVPPLTTQGRAAKTPSTIFYLLPTPFPLKPNEEGKEGLGDDHGGQETILWGLMTLTRMNLPRENPNDWKGSHLPNLTVIEAKQCHFSQPMFQL